MQMRRALAAMSPYRPGEERPGVEKLASNENPLGVSPAALAAARDAASRASMYPDGGALQLKRAIASLYRLDESWIFVGNGSGEVLTLTTGAYVNPGERCLIAEHTFSLYQFAVRLFDGDPVRVPMNRYDHDLGAFLDRIDENTRAVFVCSPNNPTGLAVDGDSFLSFLERVPSEVLVVVDHAYQEYRNSPSALDASSLVTSHDNLVVLRTFSKIYGMAGFRLGYGIANPARIDEIERTRLPFNVGLVTQQAALAALGDTAFMNESIAMNRRSVERMYGFLDRLGYDYLETQANFVSIRVGERAAEFVEHCAQTGATIRHLRSFGMPDWVRITAGTDDQVSIIERAFETFTR